MLFFGQIFGADLEGSAYRDNAMLFVR